MSPQQDMLKMQTCVLKVNIHCQGCKKKVQKLLNKVEGVYGTEVDAEKGRVTVSGVADPMTLINKLAKSGKPAELLEPSKGQQKSISLSTDNGQNAKVRVIEPGGDTNKVPKGMKVIKKVMKVMMDDQDELKASNAKDEGVTDYDGMGKHNTEFGLGNNGTSAAKGKGSRGWAGKLGSGKKGGGHIENGKRMGNEWNGKANSGVGGDRGLDGANHGQGAVATKTGRMGQMVHIPLAQVPTSTGGYYQANLPYDYQQQNHMAAVIMNHPQHPMGSNDMYHHPRSDSSGRPPPAADPVAHIFSDENANGCSIM